MLESAAGSKDRFERHQAVMAGCRHPTGSFTEFSDNELDGSLVGRFERQVLVHPDRLAVATDDYGLTYQELNRETNRVAQAVLSQLGEGKEPVALLLDHGPQGVAAVMGVLKAGKFYVPLDPMHPESRSADILSISGAGLILTDDRNLALAGRLTQDAGKLLNIDNLDSNLSGENIKLRVFSDTISFVLFTSGSTGRPKGVVQTHRNILHDIMNYTNALHICPEDRLSLLRPLSFVGATRQLFGALLNGAAVFPFDLRVEGFEYLAEWFVRREISVYRGVPTILRRLTAGLTGSEQFPSVRVIYLGGEQTDESDVAAYTRHFGSDCILVSAMGSTETLESCWYFVDKETRIVDRPVPVGYAVEGKEISVVDDKGVEVGSDEVGELVVRSRYLSPGYWRDPDLTSRSFSADPKGEGYRMYRTGDLASISSDGCLTYSGRKDFQVNIRGHSIQVAEVETVLRCNNGVREAVVVAREDQPGESRLVAYVVPATQTGPTVSQLRHAVAQSLPEYMVPSAFVELDALPLNASGKVDRRALPAPGTSRPALDTEFVESRTPVERVLARMWGEVLGLDQVGIDDDFMELGGDSLRASQVISRVLGVLGVDIPLRSLFQASTVADMALAVTQSHAAQKGDTELESVLAELGAMPSEQVRKLLADQEYPRAS